MRNGTQPTARGRGNGRSALSEMVGPPAISADGFDKAQLFAALVRLKRGDFSVRLPAHLDGIDGKIADAFNAAVELNQRMVKELERLSAVVGKEGKIAQRASLGDVSGGWAASVQSVNGLIGDLVHPTSETARVIGAVAKGDLSQTMALEVDGRPLKGEFYRTAKIVNTMVDQLGSFASEVTRVAREVGTEGKLGGQASVPGAAGTWKDLTENVNQLAANLTTQVRAIAEVATAVTKGDLTRSIAVEASGEVAALKDKINEMIRNLKDTTLKNSEQDWLKTNLAKFSRMLQGQKDLLTVGRLILSELAPVVSAQHGVFYILDSGAEEAELRLLASYAHRERKSVGNRFKLGEGLVGQCGLEKEKILLTGVPPDYIQIASGLGEAAPMNIIVLPVIFEGQVKAVIELASFDRFNTTHQAFLDQLTESIGIVLNTIEANTRTEDLLKQSQSLARELQSQQEELRQTNQKLEEKATLLAEQNAEVERKNQEVEQARRALEEKAEQLALTSKYKSEFLANMSHELRTPLNSLLILSDQLSKNPDGNLTPRQMEFAKTIHSSGNDLLTLINDILDLSKIESGTVVIEVGELRVSDLHDYVERAFRHVAEAKSLQFSIDLDPGLPRSIHTDSKRLQQVIKNLLSNAFKFTERGGVALTVAPAREGWSADNESLNHARSVVAISVRDTGIGIPSDKQHIIFEAFQQADGSTSRKYGGTGLGLAISREIARLLGGEIRVASEPGAGSTFTLYLPQSYAPPKSQRKPALIPAEPRNVPAIATPHEPIEALSAAAETDDRAKILPDDRVLLIVDNDENFATFLLDVVRENGFKGLIATTGAAAIALARDHRPDAITLDIRLPDIDGWKVLDRLKSDLGTRHIPVHVISTEDEAVRGLSLGAIGVITKPIRNRETLDRVFAGIRDSVERPASRLLLVSPGSETGSAIAAVFDDTPIAVKAVATSAEALAAAQAESFGCAVVAATAADRSAVELVEALARANGSRRLPVVLYAREGLAKKDETAMKRLAAVEPVKEVRSLERLLDQAALFMHLPMSALAAPKKEAIEALYRSETILAGKKVLIVDDDVRNIFALTSVLERHDMVVVSAETGRGAIEVLQRVAGVDVVLMDIMMPGMDGYETIRAIRRMSRFRSLPIIAVTAKAMKGDREKTIEAGAWDYLSKPVDSAQMLSVLRAWLYR